MTIFLAVMAVLGWILWIGTFTKLNLFKLLPIPAVFTFLAFNHQAEWMTSQMAGWLILLTSFKCYVLDLFFTPVVVAISQDEVPTSDESSWQEILSNIFVVLGCLLLVVQTENFTSFSNLLSTPKEIQPQGKIIKVTPLPKVEGVIQQYQVEYKNGVTIKTFNKPDEQN